MNCSIWSVMACNSIMFSESGWEASKIIPERLFARVATAGDFTVPSMCLWQLCRVAFVRSRAQNGSIAAEGRHHHRARDQWWKWLVYSSRVRQSDTPSTRDCARLSWSSSWHEVSLKGNGKAATKPSWMASHPSQWDAWTLIAKPSKPGHVQPNRQAR